VKWVAVVVAVLVVKMTCQSEEVNGSGITIKEGNG
jgi:hypothetical protein